MRVYVIIPTTRWSSSVDRALTSVEQSEYVRTIVVVNAPGVVPPSGVNAEIVTETSRRGFAAACNAGARSALRQSAEVLLFLNDDATLPPTWVQALRPFADPSVGVIGFQVEGPAGRRSQYATSTHVAHDGYGVHAGPTLDGCAFLIRAAEFEDLGGFDESFGMYGEETDLFLRMQRRGQVLIEAPFLVFHEGEGTMGERSFRRAWYGMRNPIRVQVLNGSGSTFLRAVGSLLIHSFMPRAFLHSEESHIRRKRELPWIVRVPIACLVLVTTIVDLPSLGFRRVFGRRGDLKR